VGKLYYFDVLYYCEIRTAPGLGRPEQVSAVVDLVNPNFAQVFSYQIALFAKKKQFNNFDLRLINGAS